MVKKIRDVKRKKKRWVNILASKEFDNTKIGESLVEEASSLVGKTVKINLMALMNDPKKQNMNILFKIIQVNGDNVEADVTGYEVGNAFIKRLVRKGNEKIEDSFNAVSKDGKKFAVKPILVTRHKLNRSVITCMRKRIREFVIEAFKNELKDNIFNSVVSNKLQMDIKGNIKKIYPVASCELKVLRVI